MWAEPEEFPHHQHLDQRLKAPPELQVELMMEVSQEKAVWVEAPSEVEKEEYLSSDQTDLLEVAER